MKSGFTAIILAAGLSSRINQFKPLLPLGATTVVGRVISLFRQHDLDVILVAGHRQDELLAAADLSGVTVAENPDYADGMFTSVCAGVKRLSEDCPGFFVIPVDIPLVRPATVARLLEAAAQHPGRIIYPAFSGKRGHPTFIPAEMVAPILSWPGDGGLKAVLNTRPDLALEVPVADGNILLDIDTEDDYRRILARLDNYDIPTEEECAAVFDICGTSPETRRHGAKVAEAAVSIIGGLNNRGFNLDVPLVRAAAILHDIAKGQPKHDIAGGKILQGMGFDRVGEIVAVHTDLAPDAEVTLEAKTVYLADKLVAGEQRVSLEERYSASGRRFEVTPEVAQIILGRRRRAERIKQQMEELLGCSVEDLVP